MNFHTLANKNSNKSRKKIFSVLGAVHEDMISALDDQNDNQKERNETKSMKKIKW